MEAFFITAQDEYGAFYDAETFETLEDAKSALSSLYDALEDAAGFQAYSLRCAIAELSQQISAAECLSD